MVVCPPLLPRVLRLKFLTTGGSDYPLEELKIAGVDLTKPDTVRSALRVFDETIDELAKILL